MSRRPPVRRSWSLEKRLDYYTEIQGECWVWVGNRYADGYGRMNYQGSEHRAHRIAFELATGVTIPAGMVVNHLCGVRACVRPDHLEMVTAQQNAQYLTVLNARNTSGYRGVSWSTERGQWRVRIKASGKWHHLGYFDTPEAANLTAIAGRARLHSVPEYADVAARLAA